MAQALISPASAKQDFLREEDEKPSEQSKQWYRADEVLIPYLGRPGSFTQISYASVLFDDDILASLKDKTIIVGMTAAGIGTRFATPVSSLNHQFMSGAEWHANVYSMLQHDRAIHPVPNTWVVIISIAWIMLVLLGISLTKKNLTVPLLTLMSIIGIFSIYQLLKSVHVWIPPGAALLGTLAAYPLANWRHINQFVRSFLINKLRSSTALESIKDGVIITDANDLVVYVNKGAENILRTEFKHIKDRNLQQILHIHSNCASQPDKSAVNKILTRDPDKPGTLECNLKTRYGDERSIRITRNQLYDEQKMLIGSVIAITDLTDTIELAQQVAYQESYDALTKLPNRSKLLSQFDQMIQEAEDTGKTITVFFVALDNFKKINDAMGHQAGDKLLRMVSFRLFETVRHNDCIARWGGDEFIVLFNHLDNIDSSAEMAQQILDAVKQKFEIDGMEIFVAASIGISLYPNDGLVTETLLKRAETAMHTVKTGWRQPF